MNSSAGCLRESSLVKTAVLSISLTGDRTGSVRLLPTICDRSLFRTSALYFRMLPSVSDSFVWPRGGHIGASSLGLRAQFWLLIFHGDSLRFTEASFRKHDPRTLS